MKYCDKYPNMIPIDDVCGNIMRGNERKPCAVCGNQTEYIEINYEAPFCSEECVQTMDRMAEEHYKQK